MRTALALAAIVLAYGVAGRLDYDTEAALAQAHQHAPAPLIAAREVRP